MAGKLRTIRLYGVLGTLFGRVHYLDVKSTQEAIKALSVVIPGFKRFMLDAHKRGLTFACFIGDTNIGKEALEFPAGRDEIRVAPVLMGSKRGGLFQTILGAALVVVGIYFHMPMLTSMGASMFLGGVVQMLSPQTSGLSGTVNNGTSYYFNGPVNSSSQGEALPYVYGDMLVGSKVGSSGIYAQDVA